MAPDRLNAPVGIDAVDRDALVDLALRLIAQSSPSGQERGVAAIVQEALRQRGFTVEVDRLGNVTGTFDAGTGPLVLLDSHMDTVGVSDPALWSHDPAGELADGRIYGRGAMDMKGQLAASIIGASLAAASLRNGRIVVCASIAEEPAEGVALASVAERLNPDYVIICESTSLGLATAQRGRAEIVVEVEGRTSHSSRPDLGINAVEAMADIIRACRGVSRPRHDVLGEGILVLTDIASRPYPAMSVIPDRCVATFDRRTLPGETEHDILTPIRAIAEQAAARHQAPVSVHIATDALSTYTGERIEYEKYAAGWQNHDDSSMSTALAALAAAGLPAQTTHYYACTNGSGTAARLNIPTVGYGPGDMEIAHTVDEHIDIDELAIGAYGYATLVTALTSHGEPSRTSSP